MDAMKAAFAAADADASVRALVVTGAGRYYCSGVAFGEMLGPMLPSTLLKMGAAKNEALFENFIGFSKPLFIAANGPALGAGCSRHIRIPAAHCGGCWFLK